MGMLVAFSSLHQPLTQMRRFLFLPLRLCLQRASNGGNTSLSASFTASTLKATLRLFLTVQKASNLLWKKKLQRVQVSGTTFAFNTSETMLLHFMGRRWAIYSSSPASRRQQQALMMFSTRLKRKILPVQSTYDESHEINMRIALRH